MKKLLTLILLGTFLFSVSGTVLANGPERKVAVDKKAITEKKAEREEIKANNAELKQMAKDVKAKHKETVALMKEIQTKKQKLRKMVTGLIEDNDADTAKIVTQVSTDIKSILSITKEIKGLGVQSKGLWGEFNKAKKDKDFDKAKEILKKIADNIDAKNAQLTKISATLDGIIVDMGV